jgi:hypothetical protein
VLKMFLGLFVLFCTAAIAEPESHQDVGITISTTSASIAEMVYVGTDHEMPKGGSFVIAIDPKALPVARAKEVQGYLEAALQAMPSWMYIALRNSEGDNECMVLINDSLNYYSYFSHFFWQHHGLDDESNPIRKELRRHGFRQEPYAFNALETLVCDSTKKGVEKVISHFEAHTKQRLTN